MSNAEICARPPKTTLSPYTMVERVTHIGAKAKRADESVSDPQYWRYDVSQKRQRHGEGDGEKLCFKFTSSGSCPRGEKCHFRHDDDARQQSKMRVCFDFLNKGKCERGPDCKFKHSLVEENDSASSRRSLTETPISNRCFHLTFSPALFLFLNISWVSSSIYFLCR